MMISTRGRYALRVLVDMAEHQGDGFMTLREVAQRQDISEKYLEAIVKELVKNNILSGVRGKGGGYRLTRLPEQIVVYDVLTAMEGTLVPVACLEEGSRICPRMSVCQTLPMWSGLSDLVTEYLRRFTVRDLMKQNSDSYDYVI